MHSSRMCTARLLPISPSMHCLGGCTWSWGVYLVPRDVPGPRGYTWSWGDVPGLGGLPDPIGVYLVPGGVYLLWGCTWSWGVYLVLWRRVPAQGVYLVPEGDLPTPTCGQTHTCKNITFTNNVCRRCNEPNRHS